MSSDSDRPMTARRQLRLAVVSQLSALNIAKVFSPGTYPTDPENLPVLLVNAPTEAKQSLNKGLATFSTGVTLWVQGQVSRATAEDAQDAVELLLYQVEEAILKGYWINKIVEEFSSVTTDIQITAEGGPILAGFRMIIVAKTFELFDATAEPTAPAVWPPADPVLAPLQQVGIHADLTNVFSPTGTFPDPAFPDAVVPAPRTTGPDGRDEGVLEITLPQ